MAGKTPKYMTIVQWGKTKIESGLFSVGDRFYSEKELSARFGLSRQTVRRALEILEEDKYIHRRRGSGTYVAYNVAESRPKTMNVGVISTYLDDYIFPGIIRGIETVLTGHGYTIQFAYTRNQVANESRALQNMLEKGVDGLIVEPTKSGLPCLNLETYQQIWNKKLPLVFFNAAYPGLSFPMVSLDDEAAGMQVTRYLINAGHTRIAGVFLLDDRQGHLRYLGYLKALREAGLTVPDENILWYSTEDIPGLFEQPERILRRLDGCTALVCYNDLIAVRAIRFFREHGMRVPEDISITGVDNCDRAALCDPPLTSILHPMEELGKKAAEILVGMMNGREGETMQFSPQLMERFSVKKIPKLK